MTSGCRPGLEDPAVQDPRTLQVNPAVLPAPSHSAVPSRTALGALPGALPAHPAPLRDPWAAVIQQPGRPGFPHRLLSAGLLAVVAPSPRPRQVPQTRSLTASFSSQVLGNLLSFLPALLPSSLPLPEFFSLFLDSFPFFFLTQCLPPPHMPSFPAPIFVAHGEKPGCRVGSGVSGGAWQGAHPSQLTRLHLHPDHTRQRPPLAGM